MQAVRDFLSSHGFSCPELQPDGSFYRFGRNGSKDSAWAVAWQNARINDGTFYYVATFGDFRTGEKHNYVPEKLSRHDQHVVTEQLKAKAEEEVKKREAAQAVVSVEAERRFMGATKQGETDYMKRKLIPDLYGCGIYRDSVQVPMRDTKGCLWGLQTITADGQKFFMKGARKKGCFHTIGKPLSEALTAYLCEGLATGSSIYQACGGTIVVAFDCGNLIDVTQALKAEWPSLEIIVCGDDDVKNPANPGREKAEKAALIGSGMAIFPDFPNGSDFNDLHVAQGIEAVKNKIVGTPPEKTSGFLPLGYRKGTHFFYHVPSRDIVEMTSFTTVQMYRLAPEDYWQAHYIGKKGVNFTKAMHDLVQMSSAIGPFNPNRIRGSGVWMDEGRTVYNNGRTLTVDGRVMSLPSIDSWHVYVQTVSRLPDLNPNRSTKADGKRIQEICKRFKWKNKTDYMQLVGWIFNARIVGAMQIRPHIWLTGGKGTGKSTVMEQFIAPLLGNPNGRLHVIGASTEAGIRQASAMQAKPLIADEFEANNRQSQERGESTMELLRNSWSASAGKIIKGSASGQEVEYPLHFSALVSSIRVKLENDADRSRFSILELMEHGSLPEQWQELYELLCTIDEELGERFFSRAVFLLRNVIASQLIIGRHLAKKVSQRYGQQVGTNLAGFWHSTEDAVITEAEAAELVALFVADTEDDENIRQEINDEQECLNHLLTTILDLKPETALSSLQISISDAISKEPEALVKFGIKVVGDRFLVANNHTELGKLYRGTHWGKHWAKSLKRLPGAQAGGLARFGGKNMVSRSVSLPISIV